MVGPASDGLCRRFGYTPGVALSSKRLPAPPPFVVRAASALRKLLLRAADAVVPPQAAVLQRILASVEVHLLAELARVGVPDLLERAAMTADELAAKTGTDPDAMARTLRAAVFAGYFNRGADGRFTNNRMSRALLDAEGSARTFMLYFGSRSNQHAWADFGETLRGGKNAFARVHGMSVWQWFDRHPEERETFANAMMGLTMMEAASVASTYPFGQLGKLCDVGGGRGTQLSEILLHHPGLSGMLVDAPGVLESARRLLAERGVTDRVELVAGSFFDAVPRGADAYLLKNVLHDWDDERARTILGNCRAAMTPGQRIIIVEQLVEPDSETLATMVDVHMMVVCDEGRERSRADFDRLLRASGFRMDRVFVTTTTMGIVEGVAV